MGVDPKVLPFLCIFALSVMENRQNLTQSQNLSNICARDFGVPKICNVYAYDLRNKEIKTGGGGHLSYKKMGAVPKVRIGDKTLFLSRSRTFKKFFARNDSVTYIGYVSIYGL